MLKLPELFESRMKELLKEEYDAFLSCYDEPYKSGLRVNTLKISAEEYEKLNRFNLKRIPFIKKGFYYGNHDKPTKHPHYYAGLYYIQEPSAMMPASLLPVEPGDKVLDLCAAPGGKSTELAAKLCGEGVLISNDISNSRAKALLKNLELFGVKNAVITSEPPSRLSDRFEGYFDKILVDAPCSGEGMFRKTPAIMKNWEQYGVEYYNKLQKEILPHAVKMLKPGGYLLYSTCTFSPEEDEGCINWLLNKYEDLAVVTALQHEEGVEYHGFSSGRPDFIKDVDLDEQVSDMLKKCVRLWPHKVGGEGHFAALIRKKESEEKTQPIPQSINQARISDEAKTLLSKLGMPFDMQNIFIKGERLYLLPSELPSIQGLRVLRQGLLLGEQKKGRFEPSQALASALKMDEYENVYDFGADDEDVIRYLKCESIELKRKTEPGWVLLCVDGFPLGWGKTTDGTTLKNKYLPGWRMM